MEAKNHINGIEILWKQTSVIYVTSIVFLEDTFIFLLKSMNGISIIEPLQGSLRPSWDGPRFEIL